MTFTQLDGELGAAAFMALVLALGWLARRRAVARLLAESQLCPCGHGPDDHVEGMFEFCDCRVCPPRGEIREAPK